MPNTKTSIKTQFVPKDHPIYKRPPGILFINRPGKPSKDSSKTPDSSQKASSPAPEK